MLDDESVQGVLSMLSPTLRRDLIIMQLKANLVADQRKTNLQLYPASLFKRVAVVVMGEPPQTYKTKVQELMLIDKAQRIASEDKRKSRDEDRPWHRRAKEGDSDTEKPT